MYTDAIKGSLLASVPLSLAAIFVPGIGASNELQVVITVSTFLFAILVGFYISRLNSRYDQIRELVAVEDALWLLFFKTSQFFGKVFQDTVREHIDEYYRIAYDFDVGTYYKHNAAAFLKVFDAMLSVTPLAGNRTDGMFSDMLMVLGRIEESRNKSSVLVAEKLTVGQWATIIALAIIILFSIFLMKTDHLYSEVTSVLMGGVLVLILLTMRDLQNLRLWGKTVAEESGEEMFDLIGKLRYYNKLYIDQGVVSIPKSVSTYRLGLHGPGEPASITVVEL
jgi:hypothetical protein